MILEKNEMYYRNVKKNANFSVFSQIKVGLKIVVAQLFINYLIY